MTINWRDVNPYDLVMMKDIRDGRLMVDRTGEPKYNPKKCSLFSSCKEISKIKKK